MNGMHESAELLLENTFPADCRSEKQNTPVRVAKTGTAAVTAYCSALCRESRFITGDCVALFKDSNSEWTPDEYGDSHTGRFCSLFILPVGSDETSAKRDQNPIFSRV